MKTPKISVIIPAQNDQKALKIAIENVINQTYHNIEIIIINDGHVDYDNIEPILNLYGDKVLYHSNTYDDSDTSSMKNGILNTTGDYCAYLPKGCSYVIDRFQKQVEYINNNKLKGCIIGCNWDVLDHRGKIVRHNKMALEIKNDIECYLALNECSNFNEGSILIPSSLLKNKIGNYFSWFDLVSQIIGLGKTFSIQEETLMSCDIESFYEYHYKKDDYLVSEIIKELNIDRIKNHIGKVENILKMYEQFLAMDMQRSASFLITKYIGSIKDNKNIDIFEKTVYKDLSRLSKDKYSPYFTDVCKKIKKPSKRKKIMFCSAHWLTGGMERVLSILFKELNKYYEIYLITPYDERTSCIDIPEFVTNIRVSDDLFVKNFDSVILSYAILLKIDVVIGFINLFEKQLDFYNLCKGLNIKTIASNHEYYFYPYKSRYHYGLVKKRLNSFRECNAVVWPNNFSSSLCGMYVNNSYVIGNPNSFTIINNARPNSRKIIICVGRFNDYVKRIDRILKTFSIVLKKFPDAKLVLIGKNENDQPIRQIGGLTVNDIITNLCIPEDSLEFVGEVDNLEDYYSNADVLMLTSNSEGFGMVINEAACFGIPSVCNYIPGIEDLIIDGKNGFITNQDDNESMAKRIIDIMSNNKLRVSLGNNAIKMVNKYKSTLIAEKWHEMIEVLISENSPKEQKKILDSKFKYKINDYHKFSKVLAKELNDIFILSTKLHDEPNNIDEVVSKFRKISIKLVKSFKKEGTIRTFIKIVKKPVKILIKIFKRIL
ncbi:MAG TPA: glycosyltransferase [Candidatus Saccharibacteria bacterium]|nr:glycosyltransferase [Candidatus Saccharibacteria bacterium]